MNVFSVEMNYREDADLATANSIEDTVGKVPSDRVANIAMQDLILLRISTDPLQGRVNLRNELSTKTLPLLFVPFRGTSNVGFGPTPDE